MNTTLTPEPQVVKSALKHVNAFAGPRISNYGDIQAEQQRLNAFYIGCVYDHHMYMPNTTTKEQLKQSGKILRNTVTHSDMVERRLRNLWLITKHTKLSDADLNAMVGDMLQRLQAYPEPAVLLAINELSQSQFFPSWSEFQEKLGASSNVRVGLLKSYRRLYEKLPD